MKKVLFYFLVVSNLIACSGDDDNSSANENNSQTSQNNTQILGKWVIYKAEYEGSQPTTYDINGECGKEVLEFFANKNVNEDLYIDSDCRNGVGSAWEWWELENGKYGMGYNNSDTYKTLKLEGNELIFEGMEEWGVVKYYKRIN